MQTETQISNIEKQVEQLISDKPQHFLVEVRIKPTNNVKVFVDSDEGIVLSDLIEYNRKLYKQLEEGAIFPNGDFSLEVSSPGLDQPLKKERQYKKNVGRYLDIELTDGQKREGKLLDVTEDGLLIETETGKGKKKEIKQEPVLFSDIKTTKVQVRF